MFQNGAQKATDGTSSCPVLLLRELGHRHLLLWISETSRWADEMTRDLGQISVGIQLLFYGHLLGV